MTLFRNSIALIALNNLQMPSPMSAAKEPWPLLFLKLFKAPTPTACSFPYGPSTKAQTTKQRGLDSKELSKLNHQSL